MIPRLEIHFTLAQQYAFFFGHPFDCPKNMFLLNHARSGILLALQALHLPSGSKVGVMTYNCHTVFNAIAQSGNRPVFIDVSDSMTVDMRDLERKAEGLSALVVTHLFGVLNDVREIKRRHPGLPIIEDCAHAYGLDDLVGEFAVFSIGQGKLPSLGDGGLLVVNDHGFQEDVASLYQRLPRYGLFGEAKLFFSLWIKSLLYRPGIYSMITSRLKQSRKVSTGIEVISPKKMSRGIQSMLDKEIASVNGIIQDRKQRALTLAGRIQRLSGTRSVQYGSNAFMLVVHCEYPKALSDYFREEGLETETHFKLCLEWAKSFGYIQGMCPGVEYLIYHLLMIPTYKY